MGLCVAERKQRGLYFMPALGPFWKNTASACLGFGHILSEAFLTKNYSMAASTDPPKSVGQIDPHFLL